MSEIREELQGLLDSLPDEEVERVLADVRLRVEPRSVPGDRAFAWIGAGLNGARDLSTNPEYLKGFGRDSR